MKKMNLRALCFPHLNIRKQALAALAAAAMAMAMAVVNFSACSQESAPAPTGTNAANALVACLTQTRANAAECLSSVDQNKLPNLAWLFNGSTPPSGFDASELSEYEKSFYEALKNSEQVLANAGIRLPNDNPGASQGNDPKAKIKYAEEQLKSARKLSITTYASSTNNRIYHQMDADAKIRYWDFFMSNYNYEEWEYVSGDIMYKCEREFIGNYVRYYLLRPPTDAQKYFMNGNHFNIDGTSPAYSFKMNGELIEVTAKRDSRDSSVYDVKLDANNRYQNITEYYQVNGLQYRTTNSYNYDIDIAKPAWVDTARFADILGYYVSAKVVWGEGKGENTFWERKNSGSAKLSSNIVKNYAPSVEGREIDYFLVDGSDTHYCEYTICEQSIPLADDGSSVITAVWEDK